MNYFEDDEISQFAEVDLSFSADQERKERKPLAPNEPYSSNARLVPVICSICGTRMYAQEKFLGLWLECPDCGTLNQIPSSELSQRQTEKQIEDDSLRIDSVDHPRQKIDSPRVNFDYRTISRVIDPNDPPIPIFGLENKSDDELGKR